MQTSETKKNCEALITGAGPSGLMMACLLALYKISFCIIDKKENPSNYSGALIIHSGSLELFQQMGIARDAVEEGIIANAINIIFDEKRPLRMNLIEIGRGLSDFPYLLMLEQSGTEQLLLKYLDKLGHKIERGVELLNFKQEENNILAVLKHTDGIKENLNCQFLIGADGGHGTVRQQLNIPFKGTTHEMPLFVMDCKANIQIPDNEICFSFSKKSSTGFFPLKKGRWRIDGTMDPELRKSNRLTFDDVKNNFFERTKMNVGLSDAEWFSVFHSNQGYASSFRCGSCFLIGDAAHVHSPVGAQGMNTGLQDAGNLAWKIAFVIRNNAKINLLDTYQSERMPVSRKTIRATEMFFKFITNQNFILRKLLILNMMKFVFMLVKNNRIVRKFLFRTISGIGIKYRKSPLSLNASFGLFPFHAPKPGERFPYHLFKFEDLIKNAPENSKNPCFHLMIFAQQTFLHDFGNLSKAYSNTIRVEIIQFTPETGLLYKKLGLKNSGFYLVRPDMYIACRSNDLNVKYLNHYLNNFLIKN